ncbi:kinase D-interacting substrate of 220 kDa-like isoform X3 [Hydractinia symbiolongicarpus]|uniref:kinase D-interacting substrate of 220 kDa-like isoform X3 n=1 Tax=Hydractinia symbiolongicarpus TaxID=13093 RepID=UPI002549CD64|nr:kinase D-interacting substrate of 220 kDa-like isoform X3 [Hydractinia symbiolongicarpus]
MKMEEDVKIQLFQAIEDEDLEGVITCIEEGVNLDGRDSNGQTALISASERGCMRIVNELLYHNVDTNARDDDGWTALIAASKEGHGEIVSALLEYGAKHSMADLGGWTPLVWASYKGQYEVVHELLHYGANPCERGQHNMTALIWASGRGHANVALELIRAGAKADEADKYGTSALTWACRKGHYTVAQVLLAEGANCNTAGTHGWTPLIMASKGGYLDVVELLLDQNPNVNSIDQDGRSALSWAAKEGQDEIVTKLLNKGAFVNMPDKNGDSPLLLAASEGHGKVCKTLIAAYAEIEMVDSEEKTALYIAVEKGHVDVVKELLAAGANTEVTNKEGETPLLNGAKKKHTQCVRLLVDKGANVQAADKKGDTALHIAIRNKFSGMCEVLLADPEHSKLLNCCNKNGETPHSIDSRSQPSVLAELFCENPNSQNEFEKMDTTGQQELLLRTLGEFLVEPSLTIPLTVGLYSKWGVEKSNHLQRIMELLMDFRDQEPIHAFSITMPAVIFCMAVAVTCGLLVWPIVSWGAGIATAICITLSLVFILVSARLALVSTSDRIHRLGLLITNFLNRALWFTRLVYCIPPSIGDIRPMLPVHILTIDLCRSVSVSDNPMTSLVNFTRELNNTIERDLGMFIPRLYRIFQAGPYRAKAKNNHSMKTRWKTICCCVPSFVLSIFILLCLWMGFLLFGIYGYTGPSTVIAIEIACCCVFGGALLANTLRLFLMIYCLALPMKKRIKIVSTQAGMQEETFLSVLKQELEICVDMLDCIDGFAGRQTRIVIKMELLDSLEQQKILSLINAINLLVSEPGRPFILLLSVDPRLLVKAVEETLCNMQGPLINPQEYLKNLIDLPFYINDQPKLNTEGLIPMDLRTQLDDQSFVDENEETDLEWDANADTLSRSLDIDTNGYLPNGNIPLGNGNIPSGNGNVPSGNGNVPSGNGNVSLLTNVRTVKFPSSESLNVREDNITEDISHLLRNNENGTLADVKRIMNVVSLNGRVLRNSEVNFQWTRLAIWVSLCDGWPYKASWITLLCCDASLDLHRKMTIRSLQLLLGYSIPVINDQDMSSENANTYFETFISSHKPAITVGDVRLFVPFLFYMDPTIRKLMVDYLVAMKSGSISKQPSIQQQFSSRSNFPLSPGGSSSKFMWRSNVEDQMLLRLSVEDVAHQLLEIEGVDEVLLPVYKARLHENNVNGRVLMTCDLHELREAMQMKFGDWQLFKSWIVYARGKEQNSVNRSVDKSSSYRSSSRNMSYGEGSQTESIPESPKQLLNGLQKVSRLPALDESNINMPYTTHSTNTSPRVTIESTRKRPVIANTASKSVSQDSENSTPLPEGSVDPRWHRSADSGFASTDVDPSTRLLLNSISGSERTNELENLSNHTGVIYSNRDDIKVEDATKAKTPATLLLNDTWNTKTELGFNHIYKARDILSSSESSQEYIAIDIDDRKTWKYAKVCDANENASPEHAQTENQNTLDSIKCERPPSLSDVPLPPMSMLGEDHEWTMTPPAEFDDNNDGDDDVTLTTPLVTNSDQRKIAFQNKKLRDLSNYTNSSSESEKHLLRQEDRTTRSDAVKILRISKSSLRKSSSLDSHHKRRVGQSNRFVPHGVSNTEKESQF